jgi:hypothetical protein
MFMYLFHLCSSFIECIIFAIPLAPPQSVYLFSIEQLIDGIMCFKISQCQKLTLVIIKINYLNTVIVILHDLKK